MWHGFSFQTGLFHQTGVKNPLTEWEFCVQKHLVDETDQRKMARLVQAGRKVMVTIMATLYQHEGRKASQKASHVDP